MKKVDFDAIVEHLALTHIIKSKAKPATTRIKRLLELISSYSFNLYYMKGKDMILSDFLFMLHLYSDTSKFAAGSTLYQIQNGKPRLIVYASKRLPESEVIQ